MKKTKKIIITFGVIVAFLAGMNNVEGNTKKLKHKILMVIAPVNFRDEEYFEPRKIFEKKGFTVITGSISLVECEGMLGAKVMPDIKITEKIKPDDYDAIVFVGGMGVTQYWDNEIIHRVIKKFYKHKKVIGAICLAPGILAKAGILKNKKATVFPAEVALSIFKQNKVDYVNKEVVVTGRVVTANGPAAAKKFGNAIVKLLKSTSSN